MPPQKLARPVSALPCLAPLLMPVLIGQAAALAALHPQLELALVQEAAEASELAELETVLVLVKQGAVVEARIMRKKVMILTALFTTPMTMGPLLQAMRVQRLILLCQWQTRARLT